MFEGLACLGMKYQTCVLIVNAVTHWQYIFVEICMKLAVQSV